ncbi:hypothetical protein TWF788_001880 [Orbilia oligospora]|uniref:Uncharacterized protein n=1 Tax=Orbilia oligospora TaxID=2813651 RepID=A0A6G1MGQ4_ORBOL|nr:hypothetical protein TWF788_001880 [Orbilia oligospora]KAF3197723.1 hypothetical protein TWF679_002819 [Orbilia oligospora]KAF3230239.1 hypothetical protein TWF191_010937 [Orbilia oligospora]KAF3256460.1 hypothetical protein TWF192_001883 [Orbilia oligospora]
MWFIQRTLDLITDETPDPCLQIASEGTDSNKMVCCKHEPALDVALGIMPTGGDSHHSKAAHLILKRWISSSSQAKALVGSWEIALLLLYTAGGNIRNLLIVLVLAFNYKAGSQKERNLSHSFGNRVDIARIA